MFRSSSNMYHPILVVILAIGAGCLLAEAASANNLPKRDNQLNGDHFDVSSLDISNVNDESNDLLLNYDPIEPKKTEYKTQTRGADSKLKSSSYTDAERENLDRLNNRDTTVRAVMAADPKDTTLDRAKDIALNSREVRLVGPNQREVEMRDDMASKFVVAMENLQKEAKEVWGQVNEKLDKGWTDLKRSEVWGQVNDKLDKGWTDIKRAEVWGQVNDKLDKGWTDLKSMVEGVVSPQAKQQG